METEPQLVEEELSRIISKPMGKSSELMDNLEAVGALVSAVVEGFEIVSQ